MIPTSEIERLEERILKHIREIQPQTARPTLDYLSWKITDYDISVLRPTLSNMIRDHLIEVTSNLRIVVGDQYTLQYCTVAKGTTGNAEGPGDVRLI
jgi:hypothetical protein